MRTTGDSSGNARRPPAVLSDFDDTAAEQNVAELLLRRFGGSAWEDVRRQFRAGEITLKEYQEITFRDMRTGRSGMQDYVKQQANLRPHFKELSDYCRAEGIPIAIVSQGLDFYIEALLEKEGLLEVPVYAVETRFDAQGISYEYRHARPGQERQGNSKALVVDKYRRDGHFVFYAGDGISDFEAAPRVDVLFAHRTLAEKCDSESIPYRPFSGFDGVLEAVQEYQRNGYRPGPDQSGPGAPPRNIGVHREGDE